MSSNVLPVLRSTVAHRAMTAFMMFMPTRPNRSEPFGQTGLLQNLVGGMARLALMVDRNGLSVWGFPDFMRPLATSNFLPPPSIFEQVFYLLFIAIHAQIGWV